MRDHVGTAAYIAGIKGCAKMKHVSPGRPDKQVSLAMSIVMNFRRVSCQLLWPKPFCQGRSRDIRMNGYGPETCHGSKMGEDCPDAVSPFPAAQICNQALKLLRALHHGADLQCPVFQAWIP